MSRYRSSGPSPVLIVLIGALIVFGGYYVWTGMLRFLEDRGDITAQVTRQALASSTAPALSGGLGALPTVQAFATYTPLPPCQWFEVTVERARYRACPSEDSDICESRGSLEQGARVCVYERSQDNTEWYVVELNPEGAFRDIVYMHQSVIAAIDPTPTPTRTYTPLPTITLTPSDTPGPVMTPTPTYTPSVTDTPDPATPPTATPTPTPYPTLPHVII